MSKKPVIQIVLGTAREGRQSEKVANAVFAILKSRDDCEVRLADVKDHLHGHTIPPWEENQVTQPWRDIVKETDAFLIVTPEYNHGYPGELKMLLDQELEAYAGKPVVVCAVSAGSFGGTRVVENLIPVFRELGLLISSYSIHVSAVKDFPANPDETDEKFRERVNKAADNLTGMLG
jgi:NAD(P)H-dependent FMN reductase